MRIILQFERALHGVKDATDYRQRTIIPVVQVSLNREMTIMTKYRILQYNCNPR